MDKSCEYYKSCGMEYCYVEEDCPEYKKKAKPVLFSTEMVKAILDGKKTQTRRIMKPQPVLNGHFWEWGAAGWSDNIKKVYPVPCHSMYNKAPYQPGDTLWVRETWQLLPSGFDEIPPEYNYIYAASDELSEECTRWQPSIHMPRAAARLFLRVKNVRVERLQDITEEDAKAEGISRLFEHMSEDEFKRWSNNLKLKGFKVYEQNEQPWKNYLWHGEETLTRKQIDSWEYQYSGYEKAKDSFSSLWQRVYGNWDENHWVWVIEFERVVK